MESLVLLIKSKLGVLHLTGQMTGKPVKHGNLLVNRWSGKSLQFSALVQAQLLTGTQGTVTLVAILTQSL